MRCMSFDSLRRAVIRPIGRAVLTPFGIGTDERMKKDAARTRRGVFYDLRMKAFG